MAGSEVAGFAGISQEQFISLLLAGLKNQDPLAPVDSQSFLAQLSQFANLQGMQNLNASFGELLKLQHLSEGANLIGKTINYLSAGKNQSGEVGSIIVQDGKILLDVNGAQVSLDSVTSVSAS